MTYIYQKSASDLYLNLQERFKRIGLTSDSPDAFINILNDFITDEIYSIGGEFNAKLEDYSLVTAEGEALDILADEMYAMVRLGETKAATYGGVVFSNNGNTEVTIPAGTLLSGGESFNESNQVYETIEDITLPANSGNVSATAIAVQAGSNYNVDADVLENHNLNNSNVTVNNLFPIVNGRDVESDDNFRTRLLTHLNAVASNNLDYLKLQLLEVPGVMNLRFIEGYNGLGTIAVFATTAGNKTSSELETLVKARLLELKVPGDKIYYHKGVRVVFDIKLRLVNNRSYSNTELNQIKYEIKSLISEEFVKAKSRGTIRFQVIQDTVLNRLQSRYAFLSSGSGIFTEINKRYISNPEDENSNRSIENLDLTSGVPDQALQEDEIPEIGNITILVESRL